MQTTHPSKEVVRAWLTRLVRSHAPPPTPEQVRAELDWHVLPAPPRRTP